MPKLTKEQLRLRKVFADPMDYINQAIRITIKTKDAYYFNDFLKLYTSSKNFLEKKGYLKRATKGKHKGHLVVIKGWHARPLDLWTRNK